MLLSKGSLAILCPIIIALFVLSFHSTISVGAKHHLDDNEVSRDDDDDVEANDGPSDSNSDTVDANDIGESRAGHPHRIRRIIRRRRKKPQNGVATYGAPQGPPAASTSSAIGGTAATTTTTTTTTTTSTTTTTTTTTTTARPSQPDKAREAKKLSTTTKLPTRLTTKAASTTTTTTLEPTKMTTTSAASAPTSTKLPVVTSKAPKAEAVTTTTTTTTTTKEPRVIKTSVAPFPSTLKPSSTAKPTNATAPYWLQPSSKKPLESKEDAEQTVVKTTTKQGQIELVHVEKAPIKRPNEIKANATVTANMPIMSTSTTLSPIGGLNSGSGGGQQAPVDASKVTREQINKALDIPGVKCGQVPLYEKLYGRSINETVESVGQVRILHGLDSVVGEWPWIARITECKGSRCGTCTGTLLSHRWIITAGHCGYAKKDLSKFKVTLGLYDLVSPDESSFTMAIDKMIVHPDYKDLDNDLTLMRLAQPVKFGPNIQPACLLGPTRNLLGKVAKKPAYNVGYGMTEGMSEAIKLQKLRVMAKPPSQCNSDTLGSVRLKPNTVCMGVPDGKIGGSCKGDSGGPNLYYEPASNQWVLFATVSYGPTVCDREDGEQWLTVSVDLSNYRSWILKTILLES